MNLNLKNRQHLLVVVAAVAVALWAGDSLVLTPLIKSWGERKTTIKELRESITKGRKVLATERNIRERWDGMRTNTLPKEISQAEGRVLKSFDKWSQDSRISITSIKPQPKQNTDEYMTIEFRVDGFGSLAAVTRFLYEVEKDPLGLKVDLVELSARENDGSQVTLALQVSGLVLNNTEL